MAEGDGWGGASHAGSNHPALASASAAPPYPRRGALSRTYVAVYKGGVSHFLIDGSSTTPWFWNCLPPFLQLSASDQALGPLGPALLHSTKECEFA